MGEWKNVKLRDVSSSISYGYTASASIEEVGPKFLRITDISGGNIHWNTVPYCRISNKDFEKYRLKVGDIVIARTGATTGYNAIIKKDINAVYASYLIRFQIATNKAEPFFIGYVLQADTFQDYVDSVAGGSAQPGANAQQFADYEFLLPSSIEQKNICQTLSGLDDKINLLQRQNKTLEQLAETLFRKWFVEEADESWPIVKVSDFVSTNKQTISRNFPYLEIEYLDTGSITEGKIKSFQRIFKKDAPSRAQRIVAEKDIVYSLVRPIQKHYGILDDVKPNTVVSTGFCVITCEKISPYFIYILLTQKDTVEYFESIAEGSTSTYPSLKPVDIENFEFQLPPINKLKEFAVMAEIYWNKIKLNTGQITNLTYMKDMLLPKLLCGEVNIEK